MSSKIDQFGAVASSVCAAHCALTALVPVVFSMVGMGFLIGHEAEWGFTLVAVALAFGTLVMGYRDHQSTRVARFLVLGIVGLLASRGLEMDGEHHAHHGSSHYEQVEKEEAHSVGGVDNAAENHGADLNEVQGELPGHSGSMHQIGTVVGVLGGLFLLIGHLLNLRLFRRRREASVC